MVGSRACAVVAGEEEYGVIGYARQAVGASLIGQDASVADRPRS